MPIRNFFIKEKSFKIEFRSINFNCTEERQNNSFADFFHVPRKL